MIKYFFTLLFSTYLLTSWSLAQSSMMQGFQDPPNEARPRVWWHWMNGNVTQDGIRKDLDWMEQSGIGGFHNFDANLFTPLVVDEKLVYMTPAWKEALRFTTELANKKGMEMTIAGSPGWSVTGGPWVAVRDGMKKYVWTETPVRGGQRFRSKLPQPSGVAGPFQDIMIAEGGISGGFVGERPVYYQDAMVVAYPVPNLETQPQAMSPKIHSSGGSFMLASLIDGDLMTATYLPPTAIGDDAWIQYEFTEPQTFKAASVVGATHTPLAEFEGNPENRTLQVSDDGISFRVIARLPGGTVPQATVSFAPATAKYWRLTYETLPPSFDPFLAMLGLPQKTEPTGVDVAEFVLHSTDRIDQFEDKAGFSPWKEDLPSYTANGADAIQADEVIDLTDKMQANGRLNWKVPPGNWIILRLGYSLTGRQNHPASPEATGLEVDKLDPEAVRTYINDYLDQYQDATGGLMGKRGLQYIILDSYEAGHMNWTHNMPAEFASRRGYSLVPWLPVLAGRIVESREASEAFLWDFRKTIGEMIAENHYDVIGEELHKRGMGRYTESHEGRRIFLADGMDVKRNADIPMSAMWTPGSLAGGTEEEVRSEADIRESASVAHIYGKPFVAAESMTSVGRPFVETPARLKRTADLELASGLNRFVIHTSVHQPLDDKMPGFTLGPFGQYFTRQETWATQARPWIDYLARSCYLLQQGRFVADALVYYGENTNLTWRFQEALPQIPGYEFDFVNATALLEVLEVEDGKIVTPAGGSYGILVLDESAREMTLPVLQKLGELVKGGAVVTGTRPERSPSLADDSATFDALVAEIWDHPNVYEDAADKVLQAIGLAPDVIILDEPAEILYVHRQAPEMDIYWLDSRSTEQNNATISFRTNGKVPELWHPETGQIEQVSWSIKDGRTLIPLDFAPWEAVFIVFREATRETSFSLPEVEIKTLQTIDGPWQLNFQEDRGAPAKVTLPELQSWSTHEDQGIQYFSGTATYQNTFVLENNPAGRLLLDLGEVKDLAEVTVNGKQVGTLWKTPFVIDISDAVQAGENDLTISVTNVWANRLIGDAQPDATNKVTFTTMPFYPPGATLLPAGLMGPVVLQQQSY